MSENKQNERKFIAMLERKGILRKVDSVETDSSSQIAASAASQPGNVDEKSVYDEALRTIHDLSSGDSPDALNRKPHPLEVRASQMTPDVALSTEETAGEEPSVMPAERIFENPAQTPQRAYVPEQAMPQQAAAPAPEPPVQNTPDSTRESLFAWIDNEVATEEQQPPTEEYTARYMNIEELYDALSIKSKKTDTIYLIEDYLKTIPDSLPDESRRQIVSKIVAASGFDYDLLMGDGILRVKVLKDYAERFARYTEDYVAARQVELSELEEQIAQLHNLVEQRKELHKKQFLSIEAEAGRLREILAFFNATS